MARPPMREAPEAAAQRVGPYRLERLLGRGGMGEVWLAVRTESRGPAQVALKIIPSAAGRDDGLLKRMEREAAILARLDHPNIVALYEFGRDDALGVYYLAVEYVPGTNLAEAMEYQRLAGIEFHESLLTYLAAEILAGLGYAHAATDGEGQPLQIVHRDISPSNILCSVTGQVKVADFGIARWKAATGSTTEDVLVGKIPYMSPEQVDGLDMDARSDLWSVGVILFEAATGRRLFSGRTPVERMAQVLGAEIPKLQTLRSDLPAWFGELLDGLLQRDRSRRFQSAHQALELVLDHVSDVSEGRKALAEFVQQMARERSAAPQENLAHATERLASDPGSACPAIPVPPELTSRQSPRSRSPSPPGGQMATEPSRPDGPHPGPGAPSEPVRAPEGRTKRGWAASPETECASASSEQAVAVPLAGERADRRGASTPQPALEWLDAGGSGIPRQRSLRDSDVYERPSESGPVKVGKVLDDAPPLLERHGVLRNAVLRLNSSPGTLRSCWLRSLPNCLAGSPRELERYSAELLRLSELPARPGSRMARCLPESSGVVFFQESGGVIPDGDGELATAYQIYGESAALPLPWALSELLEERFPTDIARVAARLDLSGRSLQELALWVEGAWRITFAVEVVQRLARALDEWHVRGAWHGGLTPFAVMVVSLPRTNFDEATKAELWRHRRAACTGLHWEPKLLDVALAPYLWQRFDEALARLSLKFQRGRLQGDLSVLSQGQVDRALSAAANPLRLYRAPERILADLPPGPDDDVYFCGCLLYELLTGHHPYQGVSPYATLMASLDPEAAPRPIDTLNPALGPALASIVERAVAHVAEHRFSTCAELALALEDWRDDGPDEWLAC